MNFIRPITTILSAGLLLSALTACGDSIKNRTEQNLKEMKMKLQIQTGDRVLTATLYDNPSAKALTAQLPLTLTLNDFNGTEKIANPPERLPTTGAPGGFTPRKGDIAYYVPWGNLAIFYRDFRYSEHLILLGKIDGDGITAFQSAGDIKVTIRTAEETEGKQK